MIDTELETSTIIIIGKPCNVILFNDESHTQEEVILQIMKATRKSMRDSTEIMMEANNFGRAIAFTGNRERCEQVESVLSETGLGTKIEGA
jgi:ATP-dependent Clp protease adaptor protein ClpS